MNHGSPLFPTLILKLLIDNGFEIEFSYFVLYFTDNRKLSSFLIIKSDKCIGDD